tara:strand:- start:1322 stop:1573 length:252 start_codon:yes stop_codon:yes gene_type:complete
MAKYKYITEGMFDNFFKKVFRVAFEQNKSAAINKLKKQDPEFAKAIEKSQKIRDDYKKNVFDKMSKKEQEKLVKKNMDFLRNR